MKKVLTVIVTFNGTRWLADCLGSLQKSAHPTDVIVIDNKSTDGTVGFIRENYPDTVIIESSKNLGFGQANNQGIAYGIANGYDYYFLLNQDAWVFPDTIGNLIDNFSRHPQYGIISPVHLSKTLEVETIFKSYVTNLPSLNRTYQKNGNYENKVHTLAFANAALWMISDDCIIKTGGFSPIYYHYGEDVDYVNRVKYHGFFIGVSENAYGIHDRTVKPARTVKEYNQRKQHPGPWPLKYYMILTNINYSWSKSLLIAVRLFMTSVAKHAVKLNWFSVKYDFIVMKEVLGKINELKIARKDASQRGAFISVKQVS